MKHRRTCRQCCPDLASPARVLLVDRQRYASATLKNLVEKLQRTADLSVSCMRSSVGIQLAARWQFWRQTQSPVWCDRSMNRQSMNKHRGPPRTEKCFALSPLLACYEYLALTAAPVSWPCLIRASAWPRHSPFWDNGLFCGSCCSMVEWQATHSASLPLEPSAPDLARVR